MGTESSRNEPTHGDLCNRLIPFVERLGARVVAGSLDLCGLDLQWGRDFVSVRFAGRGRAWLVVGGRIVGEARLDNGRLVITEAVGEARPGLEDEDENVFPAMDDDRPVSDQWLAIAMHDDDAPAALRLHEGNGRGDRLAVVYGPGFSAIGDDEEIDPND